VTIVEAKARLDVTAVAARLFPHWEPATSCKAPWREDNSASFSVYDNGQRWKDHGTGEVGDAADFVAKALDISKEDGLRQYMEMAGGSRITAPAPALRPAVTIIEQDSDTSEKRSKRSRWPALDLPSEEELEALATLRHLPVEAGRWASTDGALRMATIDGHRCWILRSACGRNAQARRLDGGKLTVNGAEVKAKSLAGSLGSIPVGMFFDARWPAVALVEGGADFVAAYGAIHSLGLLDKVQACGILGAGNKLPAGAVASLRNRHTRIFQHHDKAGRDAVDIWAPQIFNAGGTVDIWEPEKAGMDLNDVFHLPAEEREAELQQAFSFVKGLQ
jgi:hypothetical protein